MSDAPTANDPAASYNLVEPDPHALYQHARSAAPVFYSNKFDAWVVTRYDDIVSALKNPAVFSSTSNDPMSLTELDPEVQEILRQGPSRVRTVFSLDPPDHTHIRSLVNLAFSPKRVVTMESIVRTTANELIEQFVADGQVDFVAGYAYRLPLLVVGDLVGVPRDYIDNFSAAAGDYFALVTPGLPVDEQIVRARSFVNLQQYCQGMIDERRANPREDYTTGLMEARLDGERPLTDDQIIGEMIGALIAGHQTATCMLAGIVYHLLKNPAVLAEITADPGLIGNHVEETVRCDVTNTMPRRTKTAVELGGVEIPANSWVYLAYMSGNRDKSRFDNAANIDLHRSESKRHLGFGHGPHYCVGAPLARLMGRVTLETILERLPGLRLQDGFEPEYMVTMQMRQLTSLPVQWNTDT